jgi:hypothetical protein
VVAADGRDGHPVISVSSVQLHIVYLFGTTLAEKALNRLFPWLGIDSHRILTNVTASLDYVYNGDTRQTAIWYLNNNVFVNSAFGPTLPSG